MTSNVPVCLGVTVISRINSSCFFIIIIHFWHFIFICTFYLQITLTVIVRVVNVNDNPPSFDKSEYTLDINEVREYYYSTFVLAGHILNNC